MALGLTLNYRLRASPHTAGVFGAVDATGFSTGSDTGSTGLPVNTALPAILDRASVVVSEEIRASPSTRARSPGSGTPEPTSFRLIRRPLGFDALADLIGQELKGLEAVLWETGTIEGVTYTMAAPKIWRRGILAEWDMGTEQAAGTIQAPGVKIASPALDRYRGWGNGLLYDGSSATVRWVVWDPAGDWTISVLHMLPYERWDSGGTTIFAGNGDIRLIRVARTYQVRVAHATTSAAVTSGNMPRPERWYMVRAQYTAATKTVELFIDGASVGSNAGTGAVTQSGQAWAFGSNQAQSASWDEGIAGEYRFFDGTVAAAVSDEQEEGPLSGDETSLYAYLPGATDIAGTGLLDYAQANAASPKDGTITAAVSATMCGGNLREPTDDASGETGAASGLQMQWPLGAARHVFCRPIDAENKVFQVCDPQRGVQDFRNVYEGGVALTITHRVTSWVALYAVVLAGAGDAAVYPQGGGVKLHTRTSGAVAADVSGGGPWVRGMKFDGVDDSVNLGTGPNSLFTASFTLAIDVFAYADASGVSSEAVVSNMNGVLSVADGILIEWHQAGAGESFNTLGFSIFDPSDILTLNYEHPRTEDLSVSCVWNVTVSGTSVSATLEVNGAQVASGSKTLTLTASTESVYIGRQPPAFIFGGGTASWFEGYVSNLEIYSTAKDLAWHQRNLYRAKLTRLDADGVAVNEGGGLVSLPSANHGFVAGESVNIAGTTNYNATETLHSNTTRDRLWITATYNTETFDGYSESVIDSTLEHYYPGSTWDFNASTLADEGVGTAADGTITGAIWTGGVAPTSPRSLATYVAKAGGVRHVDVDLSKTTDWPSDPLDWTLQTAGK